MKKLLGAGALAFALAFASQQEASAWSNIRFGIGANMSWQAANNSLGWGLVRDGQIPGYPTDVMRYKRKDSFPTPFYNQGPPTVLTVPDHGPPPVVPVPDHGPLPQHGPTSDAEPVNYSVRPALYTTPAYYHPAYDYSAPQRYSYGR